MFNRKPEYSVCTQCGVVYKPPTFSQFAHLCPTHRKEPEELARRKQFVMDWAGIHWMKLEDQAMREDRSTDYAKQQAQMRAMHQAAQDAAAQGLSSLNPYFWGVK